MMNVNDVIGVHLCANNKGFILRIVRVNKNNEVVLEDIGLTTGFGIFNANRFLKSLDSGINVEFENFKQYNDLVMKVNNILIQRRKNIV